MSNKLDIKNPRPEITTRGLLKKQASQKTNWLGSLADIMGNHWANDVLTPSLVKVVWKFQENSANNWTFIRIERNSTGRGMNYDIVTTDFLSIDSEPVHDPTGVSIHTVGEKMAYTKMNGGMDKKSGFKFKTKTPDMAN